MTQKKASFALPYEFTILVDSREQLPFEFSGFKTKTATLPTGDYSVLGLESECIVERKEAGDMLSCIGASRERFDKEVKRMLAYPNRLLVCEASWLELLSGLHYTKIHPKAIRGSLIGWMAHGIPIFFAHNRAEAEAVTVNFLVICATRRFNQLKCFHGGLKKIHGSKAREEEA